MQHWTDVDCAGIFMWTMFCKFVEFIAKNLQAVWFITFPPRVEEKVEPITLQNILDQFDNIPKQPDQKELQSKYLMHEQMTIFELEQLKMMPSRAYVGMTKILDESEGEFVYKIRFVPCIVRPEVLFRGFNKN